MTEANPNLRKAICLMIIGEKYEKLYNENKSIFEEYSQKCGAELVLIKKTLDNSFKRPLLSQKLLIPDYCKDFDIVAFLDLDILISPKAPSIFNFMPENKGFGAVLDPRETNEFKKTWEHIPRILEETTEKYFIDRNFSIPEGAEVQGSINGGVFIFRPNMVSEMFNDYYFSDHQQGELNSFEETPMAFLTQTNNLFQPLPSEFNVQVMYKYNGTTAKDDDRKQRGSIKKYFHSKIAKKRGWSIYPTDIYKELVSELYQKNYFIHFAGNYPIIKKDENRKISLTYGITVCNESKELKRLLMLLVENIDVEDEILVLKDSSVESEEVEIVLHEFRDDIKLIYSSLDRDFATFKNNLITAATKDYLFQIDADEEPKISLIKNLKKYLSNNKKVDVFNVPRVNTVIGITPEHIKKWNWIVDDNNYINFPDYQQRILKLNKGIAWKNKVHEHLHGFKKQDSMPIDTTDFCLLHEKVIAKQEQQNNFYDTLV
ncbi:glycosyltransferase [Elizabethkingia ursingii]|uniref:glycosyltransferase n=1 Tax=Elizabethkingia ursingii TaxID=1756150 RepID=UPI00201130FC|nr:glycosyltransferase [Elizabethkingia ursingii]MCL1667828.1 glycosyltransferase [Elizabethkingia ursingii]